MTIKIVPSREIPVGEIILTTVFYTDVTRSYDAFCDMACDAPAPTAPLNIVAVVAVFVPLLIHKTNV